MNIKFIPTIVLSAAVAATLGLAGCSSASTQRPSDIARAEIAKRGFTDVQLSNSNGTISDLWAGAPGTTCRFQFQVYASGLMSGEIYLITVSGGKQVGVSNPNIATIKERPEFAPCWRDATSAPTALPTT